MASAVRTQNCGVRRSRALGTQSAPRAAVPLNSVKLSVLGAKMILSRQREDNIYIPMHKSSQTSYTIPGYEKVRTLGKGAFAEVFEVVDRHQQHFALKSIPPNAPEGSLHKHLLHTNILQLHQVFERSDRKYLLLELCRGGTLKEYLRNRIEFNKTQNRLHSTPPDFSSPLSSTKLSFLDSNSQASYPFFPYGYIEPQIPYDIIRRIIRQICEAIKYLHMRNIVHRDINLNNILFVEPFDHKDNYSQAGIHVKVSDFGLSINLNSAHNIQPRCGTRGFIAPESGKGIASPTNDIYSIGAIIYSLVTGEKPPDTNLTIAQQPFPTMLKDLLIRTLEGQPQNRLKIDDILHHPFILGNISGRRLPAIERRTNTLLLSITEDGHSSVQNLANSSRVKSDLDGNKITVTNKLKKSCSYQFEKLPRMYWTKYNCLHTFVQLVKSKVSKVNYYCNRSIGRGLTIDKCCIMEDESLEVSISGFFNSQYKSQILIFDRDDCQFRHPFIEQVAFDLHKLKSLIQECRKLEAELDQIARRNIGSTSGIFPVSFGQKPYRSSSRCSVNSLKSKYFIYDKTHHHVPDD